MFQMLDFPVWPGATILNSRGIEHFQHLTKVQCVCIYQVTFSSISSEQVYCVLLVALTTVKFSFSTMEVADMTLWITYLCNQILQARTLGWVAISFSNAWKWKVKVKSLSRVQLQSDPWTAAHQAPQSMGFSRQEYWSGLPLPSPKLT